ncbi:MAG: 3-deoxy-7-phosphoheptulonate synthase, partial [Clostridia bacterium]|nr:3-deoxy-7-phosphoheptulonate synthase [Clostridia bacterium]
MTFERQVALPIEIKELYPMDAVCARVFEERDQEIKKVLSGKDDRLLLIIGPCSADREDSVMDYITRLVKVQEKVKNEILIVPRIYTNKPRTTGDGYKGMLH